MTAVHFDPANYLTTIKAIVKDIYQYNNTGVGSGAFGYYRLTANKIQGFYWDLYGGSGNLSTFQASPSLNPNGNSGNWEPNKAALAAYIRTQMRGLIATFYQSTENCEEGLIGSGFDFMHIGQIGESDSTASLYGPMIGLFSVVFSRFQCMYNLSTTLNDTTFQNSSQQGFYAAWVNAIYHMSGGHLSISNGIVTGRLVPTSPPTVGNCINYYLLTFIKSHITKMDATPMIRTYMHTGYRMRPLPASWEGDYLESGSGLSSYIADQVSLSLTADVYVSSSVWLNPAADANYTTTSNCVGIIISSAGTGNYTYNIYFDSHAYDMSPTSVKVLYSRVGSTRTEITRFTDILDYDYAITFDGATAPLVLLEVVQLP